MFLEIIWYHNRFGVFEHNHELGIGHLNHNFVNNFAFSLCVCVGVRIVRLVWEFDGWRGEG